MALTAGGVRLYDWSVAQLLRARRRDDPVVAVCLDNCAWRRFDDFRDGVWQGRSPAEAFEQSRYYLGEPARGAAVKQPPGASPDRLLHDRRRRPT